MRMTIGSVMDDISEWANPHQLGESIYWVTAFFTNKEVLSVGKKDMDAALEVRGLLQEIIEVPQEFILEDAGKSKNKGLQKWKLVAFGPPEGVWTYSTIKDGSPNVGAGGEQPPKSGAADVHRSRPAPAPTNNVDASIRASVAAYTASRVHAGTGNDEAAMTSAEAWFAWLAMKSSGVTPQGSPEETGEGVGTGEGPAPSSTHWQERVKEWPNDNA